MDPFEDPHRADERSSDDDGKERCKHVEKEAPVDLGVEEALEWKRCADAAADDGRRTLDQFVEQRSACHASQRACIVEECAAARGRCERECMFEWKTRASAHVEREKASGRGGRVRSAAYRVP